MFLGPDLMGFVWGGVGRALMQFSAFFFAVLTVLYINMYLMWCVLGGGGGLPVDWYTTCSCSFSPYTGQESKFPDLPSLILRPFRMTIQTV